jgi:hypothetical protein
MLTKKHLAIKKLLVKKNHLVIESLATEKPLIESQALNENQLQKLSLKNQRRLEHLGRLIQKQTA